MDVVEDDRSWEHNKLNRAHKSDSIWTSGSVQTQYNKKRFYLNHI